MRFARPLLAFAASLLLSLPSAAVESFLAELEDLPLPVGLNEQPGGLLFDSADGRIVEAKATGDLAGIAGADVLLFATPAQHLRRIAKELASIPSLRADAPVVVTE
jgi:hypothetical protein